MLGAALGRVETEAPRRVRRRTSPPRDRTPPPARTRAGGRRRAPTQSAARRRHRTPQNDAALQAEAQRPSSAPNSPPVLYDNFHRFVTRLLQPTVSASAPQEHRKTRRFQRAHRSG